ncbi:MAG TPA: ChbG/HpnK family deacetylase [Gemmataceae bacterium]|nr:ChbG/HpnK family deacetylase [Gemmataceae bacterium]
MKPAQRYLVVIADDYGIGPATTQGILDLAARGLVTGTVLLVNSPYAEEAVRAWRQANLPLELGWHPCLTMDPPISPVHRVSSLVGPDGCLWSLGSFIRRWWRGDLCPREIEAELLAQYQRFHELVGHAPTVINSHQHTQLFPPVGEILLKLLAQVRPIPYLRRIREPYRMLLRIPGARLKRSFLSFLGRRHARQQDQHGFPGNQWLAGTSDPRWVEDSRFFTRWLSRVPGSIVELACHPGYLDTTLIGRDCTATDGLMKRRVDEFHLMMQPSFREACQQANFTLVPPSELLQFHFRGPAHAA